MFSATTLQSYQGASLQGTGADVAGGIAGLILVSSISAATVGLIAGLALKSYKKHGDDPAKGGMAIGIGSLIASLLGGGIALGVGVAAMAKESKAAQAANTEPVISPEAVTGVGGALARV